MASKKVIVKKVAIFPFKAIYKTALFIVITLLILYLLGQILDGRAILAPGVGLWIVIAYLTLPRIHRFLTKVYLPNYYIGRTRTGDGFLGDPVNLAFIGSEADIKKAMEKAGWKLADELGGSSTYKMIQSSIVRKSYPNAPVSSLFLFGNKQNFAYQQEVGGTTSKRHHIRFWKVPEGWFLPGGYTADWLAAGTYDRKVGFSLFTFQITHKIEADIDEERDFVIKSLQKTNKNITVKTVEHYSSAYHDRNGGGDKIKTDGALPFVTIKN